MRTKLSKCPLFCSPVKPLITAFAEVFRSISFKLLARPPSNPIKPFLDSPLSALARPSGKLATMFRYPVSAEDNKIFKKLPKCARMEPRIP